MSLKRAFGRVLSNNLDGYILPEEATIGDIKVYFKHTDAELWETWQDILEEQISLLSQEGMTDELSSIIIGGSDVISNAAGRYNYVGGIELNARSDYINTYRSQVVESSREFVFTHEVLHHAHMYHNDFLIGERPPKERAYIQHHVSDYAGKNIYEFVAETGAGIIHGHEFPERIHELYEHYDGPQEVYNF